MQPVNNNINQQQQTFRAHPDFVRLNKAYNVTASSYFRRGQYYGSPCEEFVDIIKVFSSVFSSAKADDHKSMLIAGVANSQEPFSYLAVIQNILQKIPVKQILDLYCVDLQSKPNKKKLFTDSFYDNFGAPEYGKDSFVFEPKKHGRIDIFKYRVNDKILKYLWNVYSNWRKTQWDTRIQDAIKTYPDEKFDIISVNNTLGYIESSQERSNVLSNVLRCLKEGGIFITDPYQNYGVLNSLAQIADGIYQK